MLLMGAFAPLHGFMTQSEYHTVLNNMKLPTGEIWPMPIVCPIPKSAVEPRTEASPSDENICSSDAESMKHVVKLRDKVGAIVAELHVESVYEPDTELEKMKVLGSTDAN